MTLAQIAVELGVSVERVRQIEAAALRKFRERMQSRLAREGLTVADLIVIAERKANASGSMIALMGEMSE